MFLMNVVFSTTSFCTVLLGFVAVIGDFLVKYSNLDIYKALFDNSTHSIIGGLTWLIVTLNLRHRTAVFRISEIFLCALIASLIDIDHFVAARSFHLRDATNLQERPFLHCSTFPLITAAVLIIISKYINSGNLYCFAWILLAAFASHHVRDATRRGLWFYQFGSTPPLPYYIYILLTICIPHFIIYVMKLFYIQAKSDNVLVDI